MQKIVLFSSTFLWTDGSKVLFYNAEEKTSLVIQSENDKTIGEVCSQWQELDNLYSALFDETTASEAFKLFVHEVIRKKMGEIMAVETPVVALPPILKITKSVERYIKEGRNYRNLPTLPYLNRLCISLGGPSDKREWWRQVPYPMDSPIRLEATQLMLFLRQCDIRSLTRIDLVVSDWDAGQISSFADGLTELDLRGITCFWFAHPDPGFHCAVLDGLEAEGWSTTQICPPNQALTQPSWIKGRKYQLLVRNEQEYNHWESLLNLTQEKVDYNFVPVAENNLDFFRANVFLSEEEILGQKLTKKDIFRHQALNVNQFGTFYIFPDGTIHPAADAPAIGTLKDSVHQTIIRELEENHAWRQTRRLISPCKDCIYHDLCPSPSVYERILGVPACTVKQSD